MQPTRHRSVYSKLYVCLTVQKLRVYDCCQNAANWFNWPRTARCRSRTWQCSRQYKAILRLPTEPGHRRYLPTVAPAQVRCYTSEFTCYPNVIVTHFDSLWFVTATHRFTRDYRRNSWRWAQCKMWLFAFCIDHWWTCNSVEQLNIWTYLLKRQSVLCHFNLLISIYFAR